MLTDIVNEKLIATDKGGGQPGMPWATVVFDVQTDELIDVKFYVGEENARLGHWEMMTKYREGN